MDVFERRRREKALKDRVKAGKSKGATIYRGGKEVEKLGSDKIQNITQEVRTSGEVITTTKSGSGRVISREVVKPKGKVITPKTLAEQKKILDKEAKTKMLRAKVVDTKTGKVMDAGNFKLDKDFDRRYRAFERANAHRKKQLINNARENVISSGLSKKVANALSDEQLLKIAASQNISTISNIEGKLKIIDNRKDLTPFQKEQAKRELLGISSGVKPKSLTQKIKEDREQKIEEIKASLNSIQPGDTRRPLSTKYLNDIENYLTRKYNSIINKPAEQRTNKEKALVGVTGLSGAAISTINQVPNVVWRNLQIFVSPIDTAKGIYELVTNPSARKQLQSTLSENANLAKAGDISAIGSIAAEIVGPKASNVIVRETGKVASVTQPVRRLQEARFVLSQPKDIRPYVKAVLKAARIQEKLKPADLKGIKKINFNEVLELNKVEARALKKTLQETDSFVFGSLPARTLSKGKTKLPKDVDLATKNKQVFLETFIKNLPKTQRKNYIVKGEKLVTKDGRALLDVKSYDRLRPDQTIFGTGRLPINTIIYKTNKPRLKQAGLKIPTQRLVEIEGIKLVGFGEQTTRKALGTLQVILEKGVRRAKDPAAFVESLEIQLAGLKGKIPKSNIVQKYLLKTKAKDLENAIKLLKSKQFSNLLEKKVPGLTKEYPIIKKVSNLSSKAKRKIKSKVYKRIKQIKEKVKPKKTIKKQTKAKTKKEPSKVPKSKIPKSRLPKSKVPSKVTKSRVPKSKTPKSKVPKSKIPSTIKPSIIPPSRIPKSKIPSNIKPSVIPTSKVPSIIKQSKIPASKVPSVIPVGSAIVTPPPTNKVYLVSKDIDKLKNNQVALFEASFRERRNRNKPYNKKTNPVVKKTLKLQTTKNRALKKVRDLVDNRTVRSLELKLLGATKKKVKDVKKPGLEKFRLRKGKDRSILKLVEKSKFTIDKPGEKKELKVSKKRKKLTKPKKKAPSKRVSKVSKVKKPKNSSKKASKRISNKKTFKTKKSL